jgi:hypothetical protein
MTEPFEITAADKYHEARREVGMRRHVYPGLEMSVNDARRRIAIMEEIAEDYRRLAERDPGPLFAASSAPLASEVRLMMD